MVTVRKKLAGVSQLALSRFLTRARRAAGLKGQVDVLITSSREIRELNRRFRHKDKPTDVLSFPCATFPMTDGFEGEIAISADIAGQNAERLGHGLADELKVLLLHGVLHLAGYDHETDGGEMARREAVLRRELRLPQSLIERTQAPPAPSAAVSRSRKKISTRNREAAKNHGKRRTEHGERTTRGRKR